MLFILFVVATMLVHILGASPTVDSSSKAEILTYDFDTANMPNSYRFHVINGTVVAARPPIGKHVRHGFYGCVLLQNVEPSVRLNGPVYDASDGSSRSEEGAILDPGTKKEALDVAGAVRWYDNDGHLYQMTYKAGKRGYRTIIKKLS